MSLNLRWISRSGLAVGLEQNVMLTSPFWHCCRTAWRTATSLLLARRGGRDIKSNIAKPPLMERTGWWFSRSDRNVLNLNHHPVCAASDASHFLLTGAATPPGQEGRWPGPPAWDPYPIVCAQTSFAICPDGEGLRENIVTVAKTLGRFHEVETFVEILEV